MTAARQAGADPLSIGLCAQVACIWGTTARNPGNAHRWRDFNDVAYVDFLVSFAAIADILEKARERRVGQTVLEGVRATRRVASGNTSLGIVLLLAPLASIAREQGLRPGLAQLLEGVDVADARAVYEAIRLASPAGLGSVPEQDVCDEPTQTLRQVMSLAADRDLVARQYANGFREVLDEGLPALRRALEQMSSLEQVVIYCHLFFMANYPDTLIARKRGPAEAAESAGRAQQVLQAGWPNTEKGHRAIAELDAWLRDKERGRNPGTTSDLVTASLFAAIREGIITLPSPLPWSAAESPLSVDRSLPREVF